MTLKPKPEYQVHWSSAETQMDYVRCFDRKEDAEFFMKQRRLAGFYPKLEINQAMTATGSHSVWIDEQGNTIFKK